MIQTRCRRILSILLAIVLLVMGAGSLTSCQKQEEDATLIARAEELIKKSLVINKLLYIEGIPTKEGATPINGYLPADMAELFLLGFESLEDIKDYMREIYSPLLCGIIFSSYLFAPVYNGEYLVDVAYCYDQYEKGYDGEEVYKGIMVSIKGLSLPASPTEYHYDTLHVTMQKRGRAALSMSVTTYGEDGTPQKTTLGVILVRDDNGIWLLDSYTSVRYFAPPAGH